ncbi:DUF6796 family protein [Legionella sp. D16C41]|uniref:DUF6796 family protein n=1 Tax=Legionella sp. D16C41 TaxID=3402688 RepID=UPI003AF489EF
MDATIITGLISCFSAILLGLGEFLLVPGIANDNRSFPSFSLASSPKYLKRGYFIFVLTAPFYVLGFWHLYKMLEPGAGILPLTIVFLAGYSFIIQLAWVSLRTIISLIVKTQLGPKHLTSLMQGYQFYDKTLLGIMRFILQVYSVFFIYLVWQGATNYPIWMIIFNPIVLLTLIFIVYMILPSIGKYLMPISVHIANAIFFALSTYLAFRLKFK